MAFLFKELVLLSVNQCLVQELMIFSPIISLFQEMRSIPGAECVRSVDSMSLEVLVREGTKLVIHPDQVRQWQAKGPKFEEEFQELRQAHTEKYETMLASMIQQSSGGASAGASQLVAAEVEDEPEQSENQAEGEPELVKFESFAKLSEADPVTIRTASEITGVELIKTASKKNFMMADKQKAIPRHSILGGFGTGKQLASEMRMLFKGIFPKMILADSKQENNTDSLSNFLPAHLRGFAGP